MSGATSGDDRKLDNAPSSQSCSQSNANALLEHFGVTNSKVRDKNHSSVSSPAGSRRRGRRRRRVGYKEDSRPLPRHWTERLPLSPRQWESGRYHDLYSGYYGAANVEISDQIRVKAIHAAQKIDVIAVLAKVFGGGDSSASTLKKMDLPPPTRHVFGKTSASVLVQLPPAPSPNGVSDEFTPSPRYVAVFRFGSVVFLNVTTQDSGRILEEIKKYSTDTVASGFERKESFQVAVQPDLPEATGDVTGEFATVRELDVNSVAVISKIMAQTVALDTYSDTVDELLAAFTTINAAVKHSGNFSEMDKESLFKVVAQNNSIFIDMIGKLGIKDRSDIAWGLTEYENVYEGMKTEFELDDRFDTIEFKLNMIQSNSKFFLEMLHHQKTNSLEWIIIVLIAFESVLMILDMSGMGEVVFSKIPLMDLPWQAPTQ